MTVQWNLITNAMFVVGRRTGTWLVTAIVIWWLPINEQSEVEGTCTLEKSAARVTTDLATELSISVTEAVKVGNVHKAGKVGEYVKLRGIGRTPGVAKS